MDFVGFPLSTQLHFFDNMMLRRLLITGICVMIVWSGFLLKTALPQQVDFRVNNLESDVRSLQLRLQQLELMVSKNNQLPAANNLQISPNLRQNLSEQEKMFNKLATLVIELNQKINKLTIRVNQLEKIHVK
jgi:outer membrane murein-binding lipoprotein Lpp